MESEKRSGESATNTENSRKRKEREEVDESVNGIDKQNTSVKGEGVDASTNTSTNASASGGGSGNGNTGESANANAGTSASTSTNVASGDEETRETKRGRLDEEAENKRTTVQTKPQTHAPVKKRKGASAGGAVSSSAKR
ncbi:hypothetical protein AX774_g2155 [Zancudomyces culisetae]|uniref:Uncharacterized protein n=1 Tax=Zancudomyces culisetae TaxID=1213189 RepID=A0A1R1PTQ2_ZANCU|nr:hypothetical protein AX774_g2155 [Zancudomyces culisetae]|eukprot:OMH84324.1 hypothetical protein AX774_g2155 [Zancudomyces culisetae]